MKEHLIHIFIAAAHQSNASSADLQRNRRLSPESDMPTNDFTCMHIYQQFKYDSSMIFAAPLPPPAPPPCLHVLL